MIRVILILAICAIGAKAAFAVKDFAERSHAQRVVILQQSEAQ